MQTPKLIKPTNNESEPIGRHTSTISTHKLELTQINLQEILSLILSNFRSTRKSGSLTIHFCTGGISGGEYTEFLTLQEPVKPSINPSVNPLNNKNS
jgi:hypothetical protein